MSDSEQNLTHALSKAQHDRGHWAELTEEFRPRLKRMVDLRMQGQIRGRLDASDVVQDAFLEAFQRLPEYVEDPNVPFYIWLRSLVFQRLVLAHRQHIDVKARDVRRESPLQRGFFNDATSAVLINALLVKTDSPSAVAVRVEQKQAIERALAEMDPIDQEVLILRHFEEMSNNEIAATLNLKPSAATNRYIRALEKLKGAMTRFSDHSSEFRPS